MGQIDSQTKQREKVALAVQKVSKTLRNPIMVSQLQNAMPRGGVSGEKMARVALTEVRKVPKLALCEPDTLYGAIIQCAQLGLEPGSTLGFAYLIPYEMTRDGGKVFECQLQIGYKGFVQMIHRGGGASVQCEVVYSRDEFEFEYGLNERLRHVPAMVPADDGSFRFAPNEERGDIIGAYAIISRGGERTWRFMSVSEIEAIRMASPSAKSPAWTGYYGEMCCKTVLKRTAKRSSLTPDVHTAAALDDQQAAGKPQAFPDFDMPPEDDDDPSHAARADAAKDVTPPKPTPPDPKATRDGDAPPTDEGNF